MARQKKWVSCGYITLSKSKSCVVIKIANPETGGDYYVAEVPEVLEALTKQRGFAMIYKRQR